jgi:hypothetical protein
MAAGWPETVVEDNNRTVQISPISPILDQGELIGFNRADDMEDERAPEVVARAAARQRRRAVRTGPAPAPIPPRRSCC